MIYIYTVETDLTTNSVIDWLEKYKAKWVRINSDDFLTLFNNELESFSEQDVHWFWKWKFPTFSNNKYFSSDMNNLSLNKALSSESKILFDIYFNNYTSNIINHPKYVDIDKLSQLRVAKECGLKVPDTLLTSNKEVLKGFIRKHESVITKSIDSPLNLRFDNKTYKCFASKVMMKDINDIPDSFFPSFFQEYIARKFEIRVIYCGGMIYSIALFAGKNDDVDIAISVNNKSIDFTPYKLPVKIEQAICNFMRKINLQMGSIDLIYSGDGNYVFLEVNPSGQMLGYANNCNYKIEKVIAEYLIRKQNEKD